ncbi:MAG: PPC domain-containing DNA-binding protein [Planctomycetota bacterium]
MPASWSSIQTTVIRLLPEMDLKSQLIRFANDHQLHAAAVISAVGSLSQVSLRFANRPEASLLRGKHEIVSLSGTLSLNGIHLHMSVADSDGKVSGGHVMPGSIVYTTAEIVIAKFDSLSFTREPCTLSGFRELVVKSNT